MALPIEAAAIGFTGLAGDARATTPATFLPVFIPAGGNPDFPSEFTDPNGPITFAVLLATVGAGIPTGAEIQRGVQGTVESIKVSPIGAAFARREPLRPLKTGAAQDAVIAGFSEWYVDQIWIIPQPIAFGNIISVRAVTLSILNTYRYEDRLFSAIDLSALGAGVTATTDPTPVTLRPNEEVGAVLEAVFAGPSTIDADTVFNFDNGNIAVVTTGRRLILFSYPPEQPIAERVGWVTDIIKSRDGDEQRQSLRTTPRRTFKLRFGGQDTVETHTLRNTIFAFRGLIFGIPIWSELQRVSQAEIVGSLTIEVNTDDVDHVIGGTIMIYEPQTRAVQDAAIDSFTASQITLTKGLQSAMSAEAWIVPVSFGYITRDPQYDDAQTGRLVTEIEFQTIENNDVAYADLAALQVDWTTHPEDSLPIVHDCNILSGKRQQIQHRNKLSRGDPGIGLPLQVQRHPFADLIGSKRTLDLDNLAEIRKYRSLLHWLRGSWGPFYLPTFRNDVPADVDFQLDSGTVTIKNIGLVDLSAFGSPHESLMLELPDGTRYFAKEIGRASCRERV